MLAFVAALQERASLFTDLLQRMRDGVLGVSDGIGRLVDLLKTCADAVRAPSPTLRPPPPAGDKAWYDDECRALCGVFSRCWGAWHASRGSQYGSSDGNPALHAAMRTARAAYRRACSKKRGEHRRQQQVDLLSKFFGADSARFWQMFLGRQPATCPIEDVDEWSAWFQGLLGTPPAPLTLSDGDKQLQQQLLSSKAQPASAFESLNRLFCSDLTDSDYCCVNEVG